MNKIPLTVTGAALLKEELHRLKTIERPAVIEAIAEARAHGDLSENAEYDAAKEKQGFIEGRIQEVEGKLSHAQIIDPAAMDDREMLEDLVVTAYTDAFKQAEAASQALMSGATAGMPMPPGFKLPF